MSELTSSFSRRDFLRYAATGAALAATGSVLTQENPERDNTPFVSLQNIINNATQYDGQVFWTKGYLASEPWSCDGLHPGTNYTDPNTQDPRRASLSLYKSCTKELSIAPGDVVHAKFVRDNTPGFRARDVSRGFTTVKEPDWIEVLIKGRVYNPTQDPLSPYREIDAEKIVKQKSK